MKKLFLFSAILFIGVASGFAYSGGWSYSCPYGSSMSQEVTCNLPKGTRVFVRVDCSKYGHAGVSGSLANGVSYSVAASGCVKDEYWIDEVIWVRDTKSYVEQSNWVRFSFGLCNPYSGPYYQPGSCYAHVLY